MTNKEFLAEVENLLQLNNETPIISRKEDYNGYMNEYQKRQRKLK